jgi:N-acyl-D-aspartate/D-glutamate deacylase
VPERIARLRDPETRLKLLEWSQSPEAGVFRRLADFGDYRLGDVYAPENEPLRGRVVREIAQERDQSNFGTLLDIVIADELRTVLWPIPQDDDGSSWDLRRDVWNDPRTLIGGSDAGAHLDRMCGAPYTTRFLADCLRGRQLVSLERAVQLITSAPASLFGLRDRGVLREGAIADVVVFDPDSVGAEDAMLVTDLPGDSARLTAGSKGIVRVLVGGVPVVEHGAPTGATPGVLLRSGRDTDTVTAR